MVAWKILILTVLIGTILSVTPDEFKKFKIESVERTVDLKTQYVKSNTNLRIRNVHDLNVDTFYFALPKSLEDRLTLLVFKNRGTSNILKSNIVVAINLKNLYNITLYAVKLDSPLATGERLQINIQEQYYNRMTPFPREITLMEDQLVLFSDSSVFYSPYLVETQRVSYKVPSTPISFTESLESSQSSGDVNYGPYTETAPFTVNNIKIHFENNIPFAVFKKVTQKIEVSHWGNIAVEGFYKLANEGAKLVGEYGRVDYSPHKPNAGKSALRGLKAELPYHAWGVYYLDEIGNISTSHARRDHVDKEVKIELTPRFSIFGGWKSNWFLGYNLPLHHYLFSEGENSNKLSLRQFFGFPFDELLAEEYELRVILPEGASNIQVEFPPFEVDETEVTKTFSYLDTVGRPTIVIKKRNVSKYHYQQFSVN